MTQTTLFPSLHTAANNTAAGKVAHARQVSARSAQLLAELDAAEVVNAWRLWDLNRRIATVRHNRITNER